MEPSEVQASNTPQPNIDRAHKHALSKTLLLTKYDMWNDKSSCRWGLPQLQPPKAARASPACPPRSACSTHLAPVRQVKRRQGLTVAEARDLRLHGAVALGVEAATQQLHLMATRRNVPVSPS